ncbi:MAG: hypothetical protein F4Z55_07865 [Boseongicola sp. SB0667_bin_21]|nr:hypothetical protein [Boseongicola sp. SB0667_bin_21]
MNDPGKDRKVALAGIGLIVIGMFLPCLLLPFFGSISVVGMIEALPKIEETGALLVLLATIPLPTLVAIAMVLTNRARWCWIPGAVLCVGVIAPFAYLSTNFGNSTFEFDRFMKFVLEGGRFGALVLTAGALCLLLASTVSGREGTRPR